MTMNDVQIYNAHKVEHAWIGGNKPECDENSVLFMLHPNI